MSGTPRTRLAVAVLALALAPAVGCNSHKGDYAKDGDTGAAAPAATRDLSETKKAPDSTTGVSRSTGRPGISGDSMGRSSDTANAVKKPGTRP